MKALSQPLFASLRGYDRAQLGPDLFSGVLIALLSIPISMGYAQLAGLPPVYGLYGSLVPILLFAMLSTTREFIFGVDAAPAAMIGAVLTSLGVTPGGAEAMRIVPVLTLYVALWLAVFALVHADKAVDYISEPVMGGFISGVCCEIILMQVPKLLGSATGTGELFELLGHVFDAAKVINWPTAALGFGTLAILLIAPRKWPKVPWVLVMMVLGGLLGAFTPLADWGVALLAAVPRGLPKVVLPDLTALPFTQALVATLPVAAVILAETLLASSGTAQKNGYRLNGRREIVTYAVGNVAAGLVGCCVVSGSVSRTAVNERNGGRTQLVSVMASMTMLVVLLVATPLIRFLPVPVLTAIVVNALIGATEFGIARRLWRVNRVELGIFTGRFSACCCSARSRACSWAWCCRSSTCSCARPRPSAPSSARCRARPGFSRSTVSAACRRCRTSCSTASAAACFSPTSAAFRRTSRARCSLIRRPSSSTAAPS